MCCNYNALQFFRCPVPLCKTPKRKVKRLRPLPPKWSELSAEAKEPVIKELRKNNINYCNYQIYFIMSKEVPLGIIVKFIEKNPFFCACQNCINGNFSKEYDLALK